ncbi:MAG: hypothetical protein EPN22_17030 [Nitrospirae bacterium]|nr:MAG: hypothetical protein EPN22_17030 [Nitrospirota bacterium]
MVGAGSEMIDKVLFADTVGNFLGKKYRLGAQGPDAYDCFSFKYCFYRELGFEIPLPFEGYTLDNYPDRYKQEPAAATDAMLRLLRSCGTPVERNYMLPGDLAICHASDATDGFMGAIYMGRGNFLAMHTSHGSIVLPMKDVRFTDIEVRRLCPT